MCNQEIAALIKDAIDEGEEHHRQKAKREGKMFSRSPSSRTSLLFYKTFG
ncbi:MAG: hypothetical protein MJE77_14005 [Proteobacteria bacterium]|nr:hypothetical protein [Pseudomonadota bacterium]